MRFFYKIFSFKVLLVFSFLFFNFNFVNSENLEINKKNVIDLVNLERAKQGKNILHENEKLNQIAQSRLEDMQKNNYFSHTSLEGKNSWEWFEEKKYSFEYAGENLALNFFSAEKQQQSWMKSSSHRENILNDKFTETGVAVGEVFLKNKKAILTVQVFATPKKTLTISPNFTPQTYQVPNNFFHGGLKSNEEVTDSFFEDFFNQDSEKTFNFLSISVLVLITFLIIILEWRILAKKI